MEISTESGPARVVFDLPGPGRAELDKPEPDGDAAPRFLMVLTHGARGGVDSADLRAASAAGRKAGGLVARVLQPYRVRGAPAPGAIPRQDAAWLEIIAALRARVPGAALADAQAGGVPLILGGRSNGARVACRTAQAAGAAGVLALAFPLHPPGRPDRSRIDELRAARTRVLVINGARDSFGIPPASRSTKVVVLAGETHALSGSSALLTTEVVAWLRLVLRSAAKGTAGQRRGSG
jgi:uncharacterized protein